jgi:hypothetical protein
MDEAPFAEPVPCGLRRQAVNRSKRFREQQPVKTWIVIRSESEQLFVRIAAT